ncbi:MAG: ABC transporter ATP-binding protein, partial [Dehalococcoidia bacterium]
DGRIRSETLIEPTLSRPGEMAAQDYVVVDRVGRLQLPREYLEEGRLGSRVKVSVKEGHITIIPADHDEQK